MTPSAWRIRSDRELARSAGFSALPNPRYPYAITAWSRTASDGIMSSGGMVGFKDDLPPTEIKALRALVIDRAQAKARAQ